jgi:hypothetical protein
MYVRVVRFLQSLVRAAEDDLAFAHHQDFGVNQA